MLFSWSLWLVALPVFHLAASHQFGETSVVVDNTVQQSVEAWKHLLSHNPKSGLPICKPDAYEDIKKLYGTPFLFVALVLDRCDARSPSHKPILSRRSSMSRRVKLRNSARELYKIKVLSPYQNMAKDIIAQISRRDDSKEQELWARKNLVKLASPFPQIDKTLESPGFLDWSPPRNAASQFGTSCPPRSPNHKTTKRKWQLHTGVEPHKVARIDNVYVNSEIETPSPGQATSTLYFLPDDVVPLGSSTDTVGGGSHSKIDESSLQWDLAVQYHLSEMGYIKIPLPPHFLQDNPVSDIRGTPFAIDEVDWDDIQKILSIMDLQQKQ